MASVELLGPLAWPLIVCSVLTLALILDRTVFFARYAWPLGLAGEHQPILQRCRSLAEQGGVGEQDYELLLESWRMRLMDRLGMLGLIAAVAPLLGLLGTILGMITAFQDIATHSGPVEPALIASGLWNALATTAAGLSIAVPALLAGQGFRLWAQRLLEEIAMRLNGLALQSPSRVAADSSTPAGVTP